MLSMFWRVSSFQSHRLQITIYINKARIISTIFIAIFVLSIISNYRQHLSCLSATVAPETTTSTSTQNPLPPKGPVLTYMTAAQVVRLQGFEAEEHKVISPDGYITIATRIKNPLADYGRKNTVVIHHGFLQSAITPQMSFAFLAKPRKPTVQSNNFTTTFTLDDDINNNYITSSGNQSDYELENSCLALFLSNNNYDVWLLEARGSTPQSSHHMIKSIELQWDKYWNFRLDEQALYDLPAQIQFILDVTGEEKVAYVGYSQSTLFMFALLSEKPEFKNKLSVFVAVSPVVYLGQVRGLLKLVNQMPGLTNQLIRALNNPNVVSQTLYDEINRMLTEMLCNSSLLKTAQQWALGSDDQLNVLTNTYCSRMVSPVSLKSVAQFIQYIRKPVFCRYDYGPILNIYHYGQVQPPIYNLSRIQFDRIAFIRSIRDDVVSVESDQKRLIKELQVPLYRDVKLPKNYNHQSYWIAKNSFQTVIRPIYEIITQAFQDIRQ